MIDSSFETVDKYLELWMHKNFCTFRFFLVHLVVAVKNEMKKRIETWNSKILLESSLFNTLMCVIRDHGMSNAADPPLSSNETKQ